MLQVDNDPIILGPGNPATSQLAAATLDPTGFEPIVNADMVLAYSSADRKVTLTNVCEAYCLGNLVPLPEGWVSPAHADVTGTYYLRYDCATKQFLYDTAPWQWQDLQVAYTQYDAVSKIGRTVREMHSTSPWAWHRNDHYNIGTTRISGGDVTGLVLNSTTAANRRPAVSACTVRDEDIDSAITALPAGSYTQRYLAGAGATRSFVFGAGDIVKVTGSQPLYNQWNGSAWVDTPMATGDYAKLFLVAVPMASDSDSQAIRYMWVQPQTSSNTLSAIQAVTPNSISHGDSALLVSEFVFIEEIIIRYIGGNWSIFSQSKLTGSRILQVGSPSGAYLSSVSTDSSLTGNGTIGSPLSAAPLTGVAAPTTATVGYLGQVVFDNDGVKWECTKIDGSVYYWSPDGFPALNTKYYSHYDKSLGKDIWKLSYAGTMPATAAQTAVQLDNAGNAMAIDIFGYVESTAAIRIFLPAMMYNGTSRGTIHTETTSNILKLSINAAHTAVQSKPYVANVLFYEV